MTETITVGLGERAYDIHVGNGALARSGELLKPLVKGVVPVVTDSHVAELHLPPLLETLRQAGLDARAIVMPPGEVSKSFAGLERLSGALLDMEIDRKGLVIALGGGVIGDLTGFAAGVLKRESGLCRSPTCWPGGFIRGRKGPPSMPQANLIGLFHQPRIVDTGFCASPAQARGWPAMRSGEMALGDAAL